jgi:hypothetical protein
MTALTPPHATAISHSLPAHSPGVEPLRGTRAGDHIVGPLSSQLAGVAFRYALSTGGTQVLAFGIDDATMTATDRNGAARASVSGIYRARELRPGIYLAHWLNTERSAHIAVVVDLPGKRVDIGAKLPGAVELFEQASIEVLTREAVIDAQPVSADDATQEKAQQDIVGGPCTDELSGITLGYTYGQAGTFRISYGAGTVTFGMPPNPVDPPPAVLTVPARLRKLQSDLYLAHWFSPDPARSVHCVQVVDFRRMLVHLAALMPPARTEDFDFAKIAMMTGR